MATSHTAMPATAETVNRHRIAERLGETFDEAEGIRVPAHWQVPAPRLSFKRRQAECEWAALTGRRA